MGWNIPELVTWIPRLKMHTKCPTQQWKERATSGHSWSHKVMGLFWLVGVLRCPSMIVVCHLLWSLPSSCHVSSPATHRVPCSRSTECAPLTGLLMFVLFSNLVRGENASYWYLYRQLSSALIIVLGTWWKILTFFWRLDGWL